jgi:hypothetical protein
VCPERRRSGTSRGGYPRSCSRRSPCHRSNRTRLVSRPDALRPKGIPILVSAGRRVLPLGLGRQSASIPNAERECLVPGVRQADAPPPPVAAVLSRESATSSVVLPPHAAPSPATARSIAATMLRLRQSMAYLAGSVPSLTGKVTDSKRAPRRLELWTAWAIDRPGTGRHLSLPGPEAPYRWRAPGCFGPGTLVGPRQTGLRVGCARAFARHCASDPSDHTHHAPGVSRTGRRSGRR